MDAKDRVVLSDDEWRVILPSERFRILRRAGTEPAGSGEYVDTEEEGVYRCAGCGAELFSSADKYHSGSGWPSFTCPVRPDTIVEVEDHAYGMVRTEIRCARCDGHLGHVFPDGPPPGGQRYCLNSLALRLERANGENVTDITENS